MSIKSILACNHVESLGSSSLQVDLQTDLGLVRAVLPARASADNVEEDDEINTENQSDCVSQEVGIINKIIAPKLLESGLEVIQQTEIDEFMVNLFSTIIGSETIRHAVLGVSLAVAMAGAVEKGISLREHMAHLADNKEIILLIPAFSVISGGSHAGNKLVMQEFVILPVGAPSLTGAIRIIKEEFRGDVTTIGDTSSMLVILNNNECLDHIRTALDKASYAGKIDIAMDVPASEVHEEGQCVSSLSQSEKSILYQQFSKKFPIVSFEQSFNIDDWAAHISSTSTARIQIVGDLFTFNNPKRIKTDIASHSLEYKDDAIECVLLNINISHEIATLNYFKEENVIFQLKNVYTTLPAAAEHGYAQLVEVLLENNANVNSRTDLGFTPLHLSAQAGQAEICMMLLDKGADINAKNEDGETPLHLSAGACRAEICMMLLDEGADVNAKNKNGETPLHLSAEAGLADICMMLLDNGADINAKSENGVTPLHLSAEAGETETFMMLLDKGADINAKDKNDVTPLILSIITGQEEFCMTLLNKADINAQNGYLETILLYLSTVKPTVYRYDSIYEDLLGHIVKLKTAKVYVSQLNLLFLPNSRDIVSPSWQNECKEEIARMKKAKISNTNASFYDILTKGSCSLAAYMKNENIVQVLQSDDYKTKFPIYASMIACHFRKGMKRKQLLEHGNEISHLLYSNCPKLPQTCIDKIFSYLNDKDLKLLVEACKPQHRYYK